MFFGYSTLTQIQHNICTHKIWDNNGYMDEQVVMGVKTLIDTPQTHLLQSSIQSEGSAQPSNLTAK